MEWNFKGFGLVFFKALLKDYIAKVKLLVLIFSFKTSQPWSQNCSDMRIRTVLLGSQAHIHELVFTSVLRVRTFTSPHSYYLPSPDFPVFKVSVSPRMQPPFSYFNNTC